jgi:DNA-binding Lrp family transcriptional regulator
MKCHSGERESLQLIIEDLDRAIIGQLLIDGRQSLREIAKKTKVSVVTVGKRIQRMEKEGIISGYTAIVGQDKVGFEITTITEVTVSKGRLLEVQREIARMNSVCAVYDVTGVEDSIVICKFRNREELSTFTKELLALPHVERTNTHVVLNTCKEDFRFPLIGVTEGKNH